MSEKELKSLQPYASSSRPSTSRPTESGRTASTAPVRGWHMWASGEADNTDPDLTPLQQLALAGDVAHVLARVCQLSRSGWRAAVTQGGLGDGIFFQAIEAPLRVACVAAMEPRTLHALFQEEGPGQDEEEDGEEEDGNGDTSYWEPHRARSSCVDCNTRLVYVLWR